MKRISKYLLSTFASVAMLGVTSCRDDTFDAFFDSGTSDEVEVSFTLAPEAASIGTRADDNLGSEKYNTGIIGDGSKVDMLIYAVYSVQRDPQTDEIIGYTLLDGYSNGTDQELKDAGFDHGDGQTIKKVGKGKFPYTVNIILKRGYEYNIAFWAQSSKTKAYDTSDLRKVEVKYSELLEEMGEGTPSTVDDATYDTTTPNNDEFRDAFCRSVTLVAGEGGVKQNVYLYRPLAQINVGTLGYDYETVTRDANMKYTYSKIRINRVARYLNVVRDETINTTTGLATTEEDKMVDGKLEAGTYVDKNGVFWRRYYIDGDPKPHTERVKTQEAFAVVDFGWAPLPAYSGYRKEDNITEYENTPTYPSFTRWDWEYNNWAKDNGENNPVHSDMPWDQYEKEEFLKVHLYSDTQKDGEWQKDSKSLYMPDEYGAYDENGSHTGDGYLDYANLYNEENRDKLSETFKYLSMCYVLTSSNHDEAVVINNVKVWLAPNKAPVDAEKLLVCDINNVPAQRNWRTNIVGALLTEENEFNVKLDRDFAGDYNAWNDKNGNWEWSGPLANGVYYNAEEDVIEISSKEGLLWLQRMVNGDLVVRETGFDNLGEPYAYYDMYGREWPALPYVSYKDPGKSDPLLRKRILIATHQYFASSYDGSQKDADGNTYPDDEYQKYWPKGNNFHFTGSQTKDLAKKYGITRDQAYVRLMADIDLEGEEWIPIGFECRVLDPGRDTFGVNDKFGYGTGNNKSQPLVSSIKQLKDWTYRGFWGIFDGNGHTIYNLSIKKFGALVHHEALQVYGGFSPSNSAGKSEIDFKPYDNPVWFARGLFGMIGQDAQIKNLRLVNVDIHGYNNVGAIVGCGYGNNIKIENCIVDGGKITTTPMLRGDANNNKRRRTHARGINTGGIVGCLNTTKKTVNNVVVSGEVNNCEVRNLTIKGYRRIGGIIGSLELANTKDKNAATTNSTSYLSSFVGNQISNSTIIADQYTPFTLPLNEIADGIYQTGLGYVGNTYLRFVQYLIGGDVVDGGQEPYNDNFGIVSGNTVVKSTTTLTDLGIDYYKEVPAGHDYYDMAKMRITAVKDATLGNLPMLSSLFVDRVFLMQNYYGDPSAHKWFNIHKYNIDTTDWGGDEYKGWASGLSSNIFSFPMNLPFNTEIDWDDNSSNVGLYVESIYLDGSKCPVGNRSVITPNNVDDHGACVMYVTARNRKEYFDTDVYKKNKGDLTVPYDEKWYQQSTSINHVVLRGNPYAWAGMLIAPNENMSNVELNTVAIYDCYQTIAQDNSYSSESGVWPHEGIPDNPDRTLTVNESNLRGYTVPGTGWFKISYTQTTFEEGGYFKNVYGVSGGDPTQARTCLVESPTEFKHCFFKAPYIIKRTGDKGTWTFSSSASGQPNYATGASEYNTKIDPSAYSNCTTIVVGTDVQGNPEVYYYRAYYGEKDTRNDLIKKSTYKDN